MLNAFIFNEPYGLHNLYGLVKPSPGVGEEAILVFVVSNQIFPGDEIHIKKRAPGNLKPRDILRGNVFLTPSNRLNRFWTFPAIQAIQVCPNRQNYFFSSPPSRLLNFEI